MGARGPRGGYGGLGGRHRRPRARGRWRWWRWRCRWWAADECAAAGRESGRGDRGWLSCPHHARLATGALLPASVMRRRREGAAGGTSGDRGGDPAVPSMVAAAVAVRDAAVGRAGGGGVLHAVVIPKKQQHPTLRKRATAMMQLRSVREQTIERGGTDATPARWPPLHPCTPASGRRSPRPTSALIRPPPPTNNRMRPPIYRQRNRRRLKKSSCRHNRDRSSPLNPRRAHAVYALQLPDGKCDIPRPRPPILVRQPSSHVQQQRHQKRWRQTPPPPL